MDCSSARCISAILTALIATPVLGQPAIPVRTVTTLASTDSGLLRSASHVRALSNGAVLVNDGTRRRLLMLDSTLKTATILADTAAGAPNKYGARAIGLIPYFADSSILVDGEAQALIVVDPAGKFGRVMAPPKPSDLGYIASTFYGSPGFDPKGRLVYRVARRTIRITERVQIPSDGANKPIISAATVDSAAIVRADFDSRAVDTIALMRLPLSKNVSISPRPGTTMGISAFNPLPMTDEWVLLPDGTIAVVRGQDYHIDWWTIDGKMTSTSKMPFDWKRITLEEKEALLDSLKQVEAKRRAALPPPPPPSALASRSGVSFESLPFVTVDAADLPDYYPPIRAGQVKADLNGNVWILPSTSTLSQGNLLTAGSAPTSGLVFDVVNRKGEIVERVKLPDGRNLVGFAPGGVVYMLYAPTPSRIFLERARIAR